MNTVSSMCDPTSNTGQHENRALIATAIGKRRLLQLTSASARPSIEHAPRIFSGDHERGCLARLWHLHEPNVLSVVFCAILVDHICSQLVNKRTGSVPQVSRRCGTCGAQCSECSFLYDFRHHNNLQVSGNTPLVQHLRRPIAHPICFCTL